MKNALLLILLMAVAILSYLHFFKTPVANPVPNANTKTIELGKDSLKISLFVAKNNDSTSTQLQQNIDKTELAATFTIPTSKDSTRKNALIVKVPCCVPPPIIPADKFTVFKSKKGYTVQIISH